MKKYFGFVAISVFLFSCANTDRDNPYDMWGSNYMGNASAESSSSSVETVEPSSSGGEEPSSSSAVPSSSSTPPSSSSVAPSSSSVVPSSSSALPSSSSEAKSSSSVAASSSSSVPSSSSLSGGNTCIADFGEVTIGSQVWAKKNLNCDVEGSKCYGNDTANCAIYGRLYNWATAMDLPSTCNSSTCSNQVQPNHKGICPAGWHIPSDAEWTTLTDYVGPTGTGKKLKAKSGWNDYNGVSGNGMDDFGFSALPGGIGYSSGSFDYVGNYGSWLSTTETNANYVYHRRMYHSIASVNRQGFGKSLLSSVRCLKD